MKLRGDWVESRFARRGHLEIRKRISRARRISEATQDKIGKDTYAVDLTNHKARPMIAGRAAGAGRDRLDDPMTQPA